jgi:secreted trypsin-like serine protease
MSKSEVFEPEVSNRKSRRRRGRLAGLATTGLVGALLVIGATPSGAVVGGTPADPGEHPWQVSLQGRDGHFCGGTIVAPSIIVTAAHCTEGLTAGQITVRAGVNSVSSKQGQDRGVASVIDHPAYGQSSDIAMLVLAQPLNLSGPVQAIETASVADLAAATTATVSGWGVTSENADDNPDGLLDAQVPLVDDQACDRALGRDGGIDPNVETCAGGTGTDSCYGDSGGPLVITGRDGAAKLAGVVSWGAECGAGTPGVYSEVPAFSDWIGERIQNPAAAAPKRPEPSQDDSDFDDDFGWGDSDWDDGDWDHDCDF